MTPHFSGRHARAIENRYISLMREQKFLSFPLQNTLTTPLRQKAAKQGDANYQSLWAGTGFRQTQKAPAAEILHKLIDDMNKGS